MTTIPRYTLAPGLEISRVLTGLWQLADMERDGRVFDRDAAAHAMAEYVDHGFTTFDMADHYGSAEEVAGIFRQQVRPDASVQCLTKWVPEPGPVTEADVRAAIDAALATLRSRGRAFPAFGRDDFPIDALAPRLAGWADDLENGRGFLLLRVMAGMRFWRRRTARYAEENQLIERWLAAIIKAAQTSPRLAYEIALTARLIKGYSDTNKRGKANFTRIFDNLVEGTAVSGDDAKADAIFVHHGLFWRGQDGTVTGWMKQRLQLLLAHNINLLAYHLPLDAHPELGNNAQLGKRLGLQVQGTFGEQDLGLWGTRADSQAFADVNALAAVVSQALQREPVVVQTPTREIRKVAWCTGGAQSYFEAAIAAGVDAFITGEISEPQAHLARETGVAFLACGHHATERYGAPAVAAHVAAQLGVTHQFIEIDNPA